MRAAGLSPHLVTRSSGLDLYWTPAQMVAHHSSNGCNLRPGDLFGTGTISANAPDGHGSLLELTAGGQHPLALESGETRTFLEDGDEVIFTGWCERNGFARIGFGEARGTIVANPAAAMAGGGQ
jgi:fumarylacetoacetase